MKESQFSIKIIIKLTEKLICLLLGLHFFVKIQKKKAEYQENCIKHGLVSNSSNGCARLQRLTQKDEDRCGGTREASAASTKLAPGINLTRMATFCASMRPTLATSCASSFGVVAEGHNVTQENPRNTLEKKNDRRT